MATVLSADEAAHLISDGATVLVNPVPSEELYTAIERSFLDRNSPNNLTVIWSAGIGPFSDEARGMNHFAHKGMVKRLIGGHFGLNYKLVKLVAMNEVEAYNLPQGVMAQLCRETAAGRPGLITRVGLGTFVDPRQRGGKLNARTQAAEDLVEVLQLDGREYLRYKPFQPDFGLVRGTTADPEGNISCENEGIMMEGMEVAMAVHNAGGKVIAQVESLSDRPANPHMVTVPGILVDYIVVASCRAMHPHTLFVEHDPSYSGQARVSLEGAVKPLPLCAEKIICRRAAMELDGAHNVNLGVGMPMGVAAVAFEEGILNRLVLNNELGIIGGLPEGGKNFGPAKNPSAFIPQPCMFDFYDGGGLDLTCVGLAQADKEGNVNVSQIGPKIIGCGGFINITQSARTCIFCGEFTAGGLVTSIEDGRLVIQQEGKSIKFVEAVEQITYSGPVARQEGHRVLFVTERCVFRLVPEGLLLAEVAPGIDIQRDILDRMGFRPIVPDNVPLMDPALFREAPMGIAAQALAGV